MNETPALQTERLELEPVRSSHAQEAWPQLDDDRMWRYFPALRPASVDDLRALYAKWEAGSGDPNEVWLNWLCRERAHGVLAGGVQCTIFLAQRVAYVAYSIYPAHQRKGYAKEAVRALIRSVCRGFGVERFLAEMDTRNEASYRLAESLGFTRVETHLTVERGHGMEAGEYLYELRAFSKCRTRPR
jgi:ribosomal-protein-alanine N-acetyltransferase